MCFLFKSIFSLILSFNLAITPSLCALVSSNCFVSCSVTWAFSRSLANATSSTFLLTASSKLSLICTSSSSFLGHLSSNSLPATSCDSPLELLASASCCLTLSNSFSWSLNSSFKLSNSDVTQSCCTINSFSLSFVLVSSASAACLVSAASFNSDLSSVSSAVKFSFSCWSCSIWLSNCLPWDGRTAVSSEEEPKGSSHWGAISDNPTSWGMIFSAWVCFVLNISSLSVCTFASLSCSCCFVFSNSATLCSCSDVNTANLSFALRISSSKEAFSADTRLSLAFVSSKRVSKLSLSCLAALKKVSCSFNLSAICSAANNVSLFLSSSSLSSRSFCSCCLQRESNLLSSPVVSSSSL